MYVRGRSFLSGLGEFPGTAYAGRNAAEVRAMERCLSQGGRCRVLAPGTPMPSGYWSQEGLCPGPANVQCVFPLEEEAAAPRGSSARPPSAPAAQPGHEAGHRSILDNIFGRPGGSAAPGMPGNVNVAPGQPPLVASGDVMRTVSPPIGSIPTGAKIALIVVGSLAALALAVVLFRGRKTAAAGGASKTGNRRRRNPAVREDRILAHGLAVWARAPHGFAWPDVVGTSYKGALAHDWSRVREWAHQEVRDTVFAPDDRDVALDRVDAELTRMMGSPRGKKSTSRRSNRSRNGTYRFFWAVQGNYGYGHGWEDVTAEDSWSEAKARLREYRENEPGVPFRVRRKREHVK